MLATCPVLDLEIVHLEDLEPAGHLVLRVLEVQEPGRGGVVGVEKEAVPQQVRSELAKCQYQRQQLANG